MLVNRQDAKNAKRGKRGKSVMKLGHGKRRRFSGGAFAADCSGSTPTVCSLPSLRPFLAFLASWRFNILCVLAVQSVCGCGPKGEPPAPAANVPVVNGPAPEQKVRNL